MIDPNDRTRLKDAFSIWAKNVPDADAPVAGFADTALLSARQLAVEVDRETPIGKSVLEVLEHGVKVEGIDKVVARLTRKIQPPGPAQ